MKHSKNIRAYTLTEILIASSLSVVVAGVALSLMVQGMRLSLKTTGLSLNDLSQWGIQTSITVDTKIANGVTVYETFERDKMDDSGDRMGQREMGNVMVFTRSRLLDNSKQAVFERITGYVYNPTYKTFKRFEFEVPDEDEALSLEAILDKHFEEFELGVVASQVETPTTGGKAFYVRELGKSSVLSLQATSGSADTHTLSKKIIESSIYVRG